MENINDIINVLRQGGVILYPTDTVWGLGCDATNAQAVDKIYKIKQRAEQKAMITLMGSMDMTAKYFKRLPSVAWELLEATEAGSRPTTVILPAAVGVAENLTAADGSLAIRIPKHDFCRSLISRLARPLVSTSANISGAPTPKSFRDIDPLIIAQADAVVDGKFDTSTADTPSAIIALATDGTINIIRA